MAVMVQEKMGVGGRPVIRCRSKMSQAPQLPLCPHCRAELPEDGSFCNACGRRVEGWVKPPTGPNPAAASPSVESDAATRRMEPTPSLLRAAAVAKTDKAASRKTKPAESTE